ATQEIIVDQGAVCDLGADVRRGSDLLCSLIGCQDHIDGDVPVCVTVWLNAGPLHAFHPGIEALLSFGDVSLVRWIAPGIGLAQRHGALGKGTIDCVFCGSTETNPGVPKASANAILDHCLYEFTVGLIAHSVQQLAARPQLLQREKIASFMVDAG